MPLKVPVSITVYIFPAERDNDEVLTTEPILEGSPALMIYVPAVMSVNELTCNEVMPVAILVVFAATFSDSVSFDKLMNRTFAFPDEGADTSSAVTT